MRKSSPFVALLIFCICILIIIALLQTLAYQMEKPLNQPKEPLEKPWFDDGENGCGQGHDGFCMGIFGFCNGCYIAPAKIKPTDREHLFSVSPVAPKLYWKVFTADFYTGLGWRRSTNEEIVHEFPSLAEEDEHVFTLELNTTAHRISLPIPPPPASPKLSCPNLAPSRKFTLYLDELADVYGIEVDPPTNNTSIEYQAMWHHTDIDESRVTLKGIPQEICATYLQLPEDLPQQVRELAYELENSSLNVLDQIFADMRYFMTGFEYDVAFKEGKNNRIIEDDWVLSYINWRKGICSDASTALAVILRCQGIPARINFGFKPGEISKDKVLYFSTDAHSETEAYLPPYGWVRFDATPPCTCDGDDDGGLSQDYHALRPSLPPVQEFIVSINPEESWGEPGDRLVFLVTVKNTEFTTNSFSIHPSIEPEWWWNIKVHPKSLVLEPFGEGQFSVEVNIPSSATSGQKCRLNAIVRCSSGEQEHMSASIEIVKERIPTMTYITYVPKDLVLRQETFYIEGTVRTSTHEPVGCMPVDIFMKENKEAEGTLCGQGFSEGNGSFRIECTVPSDFEVGDYCVVASSAGTEIYAPSESDPSVRIGARTSIQLNIQKVVLLNEHLSVLGQLIDDNETSIPDAPVELKIGEEEIGELLTNKNGEFITTYQFVSQGTFEVSATFTGTEYFLLSSNSTTVNVHEPVIKTSVDYLVRGEKNEIKGALMAGDFGVEGKRIALGLDDVTLTTIITEENGLFKCNHFIDSEKSLNQQHVLSFTIAETGTRVTKAIKIMARPQLNITSPQGVTQGNSFTFCVYLLNDRGLPLINERIVTDDLSRTTQENGEVEFSKHAPLWFWFKDINLTCRFEGSEKYLPSKADAVVATKPNFLLFIFPSAVAVSAISVYLIRRRTQKRPKAEGMVHLSKSRSQSKHGKPLPGRTKSRLKLVFPGILPPFPNVWGVGENLRIKCHLNTTVENEVKGNRRIHFSVNGEKIGVKPLSKNGAALISYSFPKKGDYTVTAELRRESGPSMKNNIDLRIVDYREEIIKLYETFLQYLSDYTMNVGENTTAREVQSLLFSSGHFDRKHLHNLVSCFEEAEYSNHPVTRRNYKIMYLSLEGAKHDAE